MMKYKVKFLKDHYYNYKKDEIVILKVHDSNEKMLLKQIGWNDYVEFIINEDIEILEYPHGKNWRIVE